MPTPADYRRYNKSAKGRARTKRYLASPGGALVRKLIEASPSRLLLKRLANKEYRQHGH